MNRYIISAERTEHKCCFTHSIIDITKETYHDVVCSCANLTDARLIAKLLNEKINKNKRLHL